jgi:hypothetical protein
MKTRPSFTAITPDPKTGRKSTWHPYRRAGGRTGSIPGALFMFKSHLKTGDYHREMNLTNYQKWLTENLIPNLLPKSVLVVDKTPYHNLKLSL